MRIIKVKDYKEMSILAANIISSYIIMKPNSILGLATGTTPLGVYEELIRLNKETILSFSEVATFNLDEYYPINKTDINSYNHYMNEHFFKFIDINKSNINIPDGQAENPLNECEDYERKISESKGIDIQLLGIGLNGHIGFNEPSKYFEESTFLVELSESTLKTNARFFNDIKTMPTNAISVGIGTIMKSKHIILLASGSNKSEIVRDLVSNNVSPELPASILKFHNNVIIIIDELAGSKLNLLDNNA